MITAAITGFSTCLSLIVAIGPQNAFVLRQGLLRAHVLHVALLCALSDATLIAAGVTGFGTVSTRWPALPALMSVVGALFLAAYGALRLRAALRGDYGVVLAGESASLGRTLATGAAMTWLNPHVYLDTVVLIGAVSTRFALPAEKLAFGVAAASVSFAFFFGLGFGARLLAPWMQSVRAWQVLDTGIALLMWVIAASLLRSM